MEQLRQAGRTPMQELREEIDQQIQQLHELHAVAAEQYSIGYDGEAHDNLQAAMDRMLEDHISRLRSQIPKEEDYHKGEALRMETMQNQLDAAQRRAEESMRDADNRNDKLPENVDEMRQLLEELLQHQQNNTLVAVPVGPRQ